MALFTTAGVLAATKAVLPWALKIGAGIGLYKYMKKQDSSYNEQVVSDQNQFNALEAEKNRAFQEEMSNTSYQRAVQDMKLAGINPIMAVSNGGASVPNGAQGSSVGAYPAQGMLPMVSSLLPFLAGLYTSGAANATKIAISKANNNTRTIVRNYSNGQIIDRKSMR